MDFHDENFSREGDPGHCLSFPRYFNASFLSQLAAITHLDQEAGTHQATALHQSASDIISLYEPNAYSGFDFTDFGSSVNSGYVDVDLLDLANIDALDYLMPSGIGSFPHLTPSQLSNTAASHEEEQYNLYRIQMRRNSSGLT
jgi:hypothetical protein